LSKEKPEYMKDEVRDMRTEKNYAEDETEDEEQTQQDADTESGWSKDHETPLAGKRQVPWSNLNEYKTQK
jgi:hypothetical protein